MTAGQVTPTIVAAPAPVTVSGARLSGRSLALVLFVLTAAFLAAVLIGPASLPVRGVLLALLDLLPGVSIDHGLTDTQRTILMVIRLPRAVLGGLVGAALSTSGAAYQGVFRNPLADPYLLGVAGGAGLGATMVIAADTSVALLPVAAFLGAVLGVLATYALGRSVGGRSATTLILAGVAVSSFASALQTYIQQANVDSFREVYAWLLGRVATSGWDEILLILPYLAVSLVVLHLSRRTLDVLAVGEVEAAALGVNVARVRLVVIGAATLATAAAVAVSGLIVFVGIIIPHTVRLLGGHSYRSIIPMSALGGAAFLMVTDIIARSIVSPAELPIGVVTAFFGAPFFVLVLRLSSRQLR